MSDNSTYRQSSVNLNTILLFVLLGVFGWLCHTTIVTSNSVIRLEAILGNFPSRMEFETKINEIRTRLNELDTTLLQLKRERSTIPKTTTSRP